MTSNERLRWGRVIPEATSEDDCIRLDSAKPNDFERWSLKSCTLIDDWPADASMSCTDLNGPRVPEDVLPNHLGLIVVSNRVQQVLMNVSGVDSAIQLLPVRVDYRGTDLGTYFVINVIACVNALAENSTVTKFTRLDVVQRPGGIKSIERAVLQSYALKTAPPIFRLQEYPLWVLFGPVVREALESIGTVGFTCVELLRDSDEIEADAF